MDAPAEQARAGLEAAFAAFARVDEALNEWRAASPIAALNAAAGTGRWTALPPDGCALLRLALDGARRTGGRFDPTWAAARGLWRFDGTGRVPARDEVARACARVGWRRVQLEAASGGGCRARLPDAGMGVGLGGIAKGWAVDRAVEALRAAGLRDFLVQAGGDLYAAGRDGGRPWRVGVRDPRAERDVAFAWLEVSDRAVSTSGDYEHQFEQDGVRYHHLLDPRDCWPARGTRAVTIVAPRAVEAEIHSKAAFVRGGRGALEAAERDGAGALLVTARNDVLVSRSLRSKAAWRAPTP